MFKRMIRFVLSVTDPVFATALALELLAVTVAFFALSSVVVVRPGQYGYYDSGDHYHYDGWFKPGIYFKLPWVDSYVIQGWSLSVPEKAYKTKDGGTLNASISLSGNFGPNMTGEELSARFANNRTLYADTVISVTTSVVAQYNTSNVTTHKQVKPGEDFWQDLTQTLQKEFEKNFSLYSNTWSGSYGLAEQDMVSVKHVASTAVVTIPAGHYIEFTYGCPDLTSEEPCNLVGSAEIRVDSATHDDTMAFAMNVQGLGNQGALNDWRKAAWCETPYLTGFAPLKNPMVLVLSGSEKMMIQRGYYGTIEAIEMDGRIFETHAGVIKDAETEEATSVTVFGSHPTRPDQIAFAFEDAKPRVCGGTQ